MHEFMRMIRQRSLFHLCLALGALPCCIAVSNAEPTLSKAAEEELMRHTDEQSSPAAHELHEHLQAWKEGREPLSAYPYIAEILGASYGSINPETLQSLIAAGADVNAPNKKGDSPLHLVSHRPEFVRMLLKAGADPNARNGEGLTPFLLVEGRFDDQVEVRRILIAAGAQVDEPQAVKAGMLGDARLVDEAIAAGADLNTRGYMGRTALHWLALNDNAQLCAKLLAAGANPDIRDNRSWTPLHLAANFNAANACRELLAGGADANATDEDASTALHCAAFSNRVEICRTLIAAGSNPNAKDATGRTPLHECIDPYSDCTIAQMLIAAGANVNAHGRKAATARVSKKFIDDATPLHLAAICGNADICSVLLMHGADASLRSADGLTPLDMARQGGNKLIIYLLENAEKQQKAASAAEEPHT